MTNENWQLGVRVRNPLAPEWGLGEVTEVVPGGKLRVFFASAGERLLKDAPLVAATGGDLTQPLPRPRPQSTGAARTPAHQSIEAYRDVFVQQFPRGFADPLYLEKERSSKVAAIDLLGTSLSPAVLRPLVSDGDWDEIVKRALALIAKTNLVFPQEAKALRAGLESAEARERFGRTLLDLLLEEGPGLAPFERFCGLLADIGAAKWPLATYFPYLARPAEHMFLKPLATQRVAAACGVELNYRTAPNALTYTSLLKLAARLDEILADLGPRDRIDIQSFVGCVAK